MAFSSSSSTFGMFLVTKGGRMHLNYSPCCPICSLLHLQPNFLYILFHLSLPCLLWLSSVFLMDKNFVSDMTKWCRACYRSYETGLTPAEPNHSRTICNCARNFSDQKLHIFYLFQKIKSSLYTIHRREMMADVC